MARICVHVLGSALVNGLGSTLVLVLGHGAWQLNSGRLSPRVSTLPWSTFGIQLWFWSISGGGLGLDVGAFLGLVLGEGVWCSDKMFQNFSFKMREFTSKNLTRLTLICMSPIR